MCASDACMRCTCQSVPGMHAFAHLANWLIGRRQSLAVPFGPARGGRFAASATCQALLRLRPADPPPPRLPPMRVVGQAAFAATVLSSLSYCRSAWCRGRRGCACTRARRALPQQQRRRGRPRRPQPRGGHVLHHHPPAPRPGRRQVCALRRTARPCAHCTLYTCAHVLRCTRQAAWSNSGLPARLLAHAPPPRAPWPAPCGRPWPAWRLALGLGWLPTRACRRPHVAHV